MFDLNRNSLKSILFMLVIEWITCYSGSLSEKWTDPTSDLEPV